MSRIGRPSGEKKARHFLREWRDKHELTQEQFAARMRAHFQGAFDRTRVSKIERGEESLTEENIYRFSEVLGIEPGWLFVDPDVIADKREVLEADPRELRAIVAAVNVLKAG